MGIGDLRSDPRHSQRAAVYPFSDAAGGGVTLNRGNFKSPLGQAVSYTLNRGASLTKFLEDARIPVDNNASERASRVVALGRKNFLVATCEAHGVDPIDYLRDVMLRVDVHPASRIDELLPHRWRPPIRIEVTSGSS